ncbi:hypothetical protein MBLNU459_g1794t1 [Dothideomycetes sp. NU459]
MVTVSKTKDWRTIAEAKRTALLASIPQEWIIPGEVLPSEDQLDVTSFPTQSGFFTERELEITSSKIPYLLEKIHSAAWTSEEVTRAFCKRAAVAQQLLNCLSETLFPEALMTAKSLDDHLKQTGKPIGPLHGLPISLKDNFNIVGKDSTIGFVSWVGQPATYNTILVDVLREAGAVLYVKTNVPTAMMIAETVNNTFGRTVSPLNRKLTSGGSSGGESALIAFGGSLLGVGTDIGGSLRIPAACTGIYTLRPSFGRFPTGGSKSGLAGQEAVNSVNGPMARTIDDIELFARHVVGAQPWRLDPKCLPIPWRNVSVEPKLKLGVMWNDGIVIPTPPVQRALQETVHKLREAGHEIIEWTPDFHPEAVDTLANFFLADGGKSVRDILEPVGEPFRPEMQGYAEAPEVGVHAMWKLQAKRTQLCKNYLDKWTKSGIDGILCPTTPFATVEHGKYKHVGYTGVFNIVDYAAISFPSGISADKELDQAKPQGKPLSNVDEQIQKELSKYLFGDANKESIIELPQGQLYIVRPRSPKGYSELIFKDAAASIRRTGQEFQYQLVVQRAYEEGEAELLEQDGGEDGASDGLGTDKDEKTFLLDEGLHFRTDIKHNGEVVLAWNDLSGDEGDLFEFVCDPSLQPETATSFSLVAAQCQYERKYRQSRERATDHDLREFSFEEEEPIPAASPIASPSRSPNISPSPPHFRQLNAPNTAVKRDDTMVRESTKKGKAPLPKSDEAPTVAPPSAKQPESLEILAEQNAELHLFDFSTGTFILLDDDVEATVSEVGNWKYWLQINGKAKSWLGQEVVPELNPVFNFEYLSFIFNHYTEDGSAYSWLLRFKTREVEEEFQQGLMQALWEHLNQAKWLKAKDTDRDYVLDAFNDLVLEDKREAEAREEDEQEEEEEGEEYEDAEDGQRSEHYDSDESDDDVVTRDEDGNVNSQLAVGYKHDRSFVVRGSKIGVFKHTPDNHLEFSTNISKVQTPNGKLFSPEKVMLHAEDRNMILQNADNPNSLYRMDLEYGKIVDEWKVHNDIPVESFAPESKFSQMTGEQTFLGLSNNALYRIDPRLSGDKLVESELKQYATKNGFTAAATTEKGYIAVASSKGDIRMFDRLGINAKTHIPALGDPIIGMDTSADGRWVLATTRTYLLLIDALQKDGKNEGKLGFEKSFAKDAKPQPRRLGLTPSHVAQFQHETKAPIAFTTARFNTGPDSDETTIITATGPFIITWSMKKVLAGRKDPYSIKRYAEEVKADNFRFGSDKNIVVAFANEVNMVAKRALQRPTRESIMSTPRKSGRGSYLSRNDIVNSPY